MIHAEENDGKVISMGCLNISCRNNMKLKCALKATLLSEKGRCMNIVYESDAMSYEEARAQ